MTMRVRFKRVCAYFFLALLVGTFEFAHASSFVTWYDLTLEVVDAPGKPWPVIYRVSLKGTNRQIVLNEAQFFIVSSLFGQRPEAVSLGQIEKQLAQYSLTGFDLPAEVAQINALAVKQLGESLILQTQDAFKIADPPSPLASLTTHGDGAAAEMFGVHESRTGVIVHGQFIALNATELRLLELVHAAAGGKASYENIGAALRRRHPAAEGIREIAGEINSRVLLQTGTHLLRVVRGYGLEFDVHPQPALPPPATHTTEYGELKFNGLQERIFQTLKLREMPLDAKLFISTKEFSAVGLPLQTLLTGISQINRQFRAIFQAPLIYEMEVEFPETGNEYYGWDGRRFYSRARFLATKPDAQEIRAGCAHYLTATPRDGAFHWQPQE